MLIFSVLACGFRRSISARSVGCFRAAGFLSAVVALGSIPAVQAHSDHAELTVTAASSSAAAAAANVGSDSSVAGSAPFLFRYRADQSVLPGQVQGKLGPAHGGFAVDPMTGEVFFGLKGVGIIWMSNDLSEKKVLPTEDVRLLEGNFHNVTLLRRADGERFLALPDNERGRVFITTDGGAVVRVLTSPTEVNAYYGGGGGFHPTDTEYTSERLYVADGYSAGNYIVPADPWTGRWMSGVFGGKAVSGEVGHFSTAHGVTFNSVTGRLEIADRELSRIQSFHRDGTYLSSLALPSGSLPCDVDFHRGFMLVGCLKGPGGATPASFYVLDHQGAVLSEVVPGRDFGLERFVHIHNATWKPVVGDDATLYVLATAWNPGDFAVFEVVRP